MPTRILAVVAEPVSAETLKMAVGRERAQAAEVLVVAPALSSRWRLWLSDPDEAIERAEGVQETTVERLEQEGVDAVGKRGDPDPFLAVQDALQTFPADEVVLVTHPHHERNWLEAGLVERIEERFDGPVRHLLVEDGVTPSDHRTVPGTVREEGPIYVKAWMLPALVIALAVPIAAAVLLGGPTLGLLVAGLVGTAVVVTAVKMAPRRPLRRPRE